MTTLRENFENQGIKVDAVEITVMTHQFEAGQNFGQNESERKQSERKLNKKLDLSAYDDEVDDEFSDDELRRKDSIQNGNSSVEYIA
jgi:flagellar hook-length control protein FliK